MKLFSRTCACGCGQTFKVWPESNPAQYASETHKPDFYGASFNSESTHPSERRRQVETRRAAAAFKRRVYTPAFDGEAPAEGGGEE